MCIIERTHTMYKYVYTERGCSRALKQVRQEDKNLLHRHRHPKQRPQTGHKSLGLLYKSFDSKPLNQSTCGAQPEQSVRSPHAKDLRSASTAAMLKLLACATLALVVSTYAGEVAVIWSWDPIPPSDCTFMTTHTGNCTAPQIVVPETDVGFDGTAVITKGHPIAPYGWGQATVAKCDTCPGCATPGDMYWLHCEVTSAGTLIAVRTASGGTQLQEQGPAVSSGCSQVADAAGVSKPWHGTCCFSGTR